MILSYFGLGILEIDFLQNRQVAASSVSYSSLHQCDQKRVVLLESD
jgi:hypothetical protein